MSEESSGLINSCRKCKSTFSSDSDRFCSHCGTPRKKQCLLCGVLIPHIAPQCSFCGGPQDKQVLDNTPLKDCKECGSTLMPNASTCHSCRKQQGSDYKQEESTSRDGDIMSEGVHATSSGSIPQVSYLESDDSSSDTPQEETESIITRLESDDAQWVGGSHTVSGVDNEDFTLSSSKTRASHRKHRLVEKDSPPLEKKKANVSNDSPGAVTKDDESSSSRDAVIKLSNAPLFGPQLQGKALWSAILNEPQQPQRKRSLVGDDSTFHSSKRRNPSSLDSYGFKKRIISTKVRSDTKEDENQNESLKKSLAKLSDEEEDDDDYRIGSESSDDELVTSDSQEKKSLMPYKKPAVDESALYTGVVKSRILKTSKKSKGKCTNRPSLWTKDLPQGLKGGNHEMTTVVFHALLPTGLWEFDDTSSVYIRFGSPVLGNWHCDIGPMQKELSPTNEDSEIVHFKLEVKMKSFIPLNGVPYKYCVYTPKTTVDAPKDAQYEYLYSTYYDIPATHANRYLRLSQLDNRYHHQYDTVVYPPSLNDSSQEKKGFIKTFFASLTSFVSGSSSKPEASGTDAALKLPTMEETRLMCLRLYLSDHIASMRSGSIAKPLELVQDIVNIHKCLYTPLIHNGATADFARPWKYFNLRFELRNLLVAIVHDLSSSGSDGDTDSSSRRMIVAMITVVTLYSIEHDVSIDVASTVFQSLTFKPDLEQRECRELAVFLDYISGNEELKLKFLGGLKRFVVAFKLPQGHLEMFFNLVALCHFIEGHSKPFGSIQKNPRLIKWVMDTETPFLKDVLTLVKRSRTENLKRLCSNLEAHFIIDPLLLPAFLHMMPYPSYEMLFEVLPLFYCVARLGYFCDSPQATSIKYLHTLLGIIHSRIDETADNWSEEELKQLLEAVKYLTGVLSMRQKLDKLHDHHVAAFTTLLSILLKSLSNVLNTLSGHSLDDELEVVNETVKAWIKGTVGGGMFGKEVNNSFLNSGNLLKPKEEFDAWEHILSVSCPPELKEKWEAVLLSIIRKRLSKVPSVLKPDVLHHAEARGVHDLLLSVVLEDVSSSMDDLIHSGDKSCTEGLRKLQESKNMERLFGDILRRRYAQKNLSIDDILEWEVWPGVLQMFVKQRSLHIPEGSLSVKDQEICDEAIKIFSSVCMSVVDGSVSVNVLHKLRGKKPEVEKLCHAITISGNGQSDGLQASLPNLSFENIIVHLNTRLKEYECFLQLQEQLSTLCQYLSVSDLVIPDLSLLDKELAIDVSMSSISSLCHSEENEMIYHHFKSASSSLFPMLLPFTLLSKTHSTNTFRKLWQSQVIRFQERGALHFSDVHNLLWVSVFDEICQYLDSLKDRSIPLVTVDELLEEYTADKGKLETEFKTLDRGVSECRGLSSDSSWVEECVQRMLEYHSLHQHVNAAKIFLHLRNVLALTGDFKVVEELADHFKVSIQGQTLQYIDDNLIKTGQFLHGISSNPKKLKCLKVFSECQRLVQWIKNETTDVHDLQHFVTIALATAAGGEDDLTRDKLSNLRTVGSGFAKLIYRLPQETGCMELEKRCESLWDSLSHDPSLPEKLSECSKQIEWYKSVKEMQGSVEKSSFGQMYNIKRYGCYTVGSSTEFTHSKPSELIRMDLEQRDKPLAQHKYTMDELRDLESKLVLITGRESLERTDVDHFLKVFNSVCHIAEILIQLQQHGHSKYMRWVLRFPCTLPDNTDIVDKLTTILKEMTSDLDEWRKIVAETREHFYCLNYYTTQQLLLLRKELSHYIDPNYKDNILPDVMSLLQCLSRVVTQDLVVSHIRGAGDQKEERMATITSSHDDAESLQEVNTTEEDIGGVSEDLLKGSLLAPQPMLGEGNLTLKQRMIIDNLKMSYGFHDKLILLAFERVKEPELEEEVERWCNQHQDEFDFFDETDTKGDTDAYWPLEETTGDDDQMEFQETDLATVGKITLINESHPVVKQLLLAGYSLEQSLDAVEHYPNSTQEAMEYIDQLDEKNEGMEGGLFPKSSVLNDISFERQDSTGSAYIGVTDFEIETTVSSTKAYLSLRELAKLLNKLSTKCTAPIVFERNFGDVLKQGEPNLLVVAPDEVLKTVLSLYMENKDLSLPTYEEVLICSESTTAEEVTLLWRRAMRDPNHFRIFCLVHAELLSYQVCDTALRSLTHYSQGKTDYKLVIVCSSEDQDKSHIIAKLQIYKRPFSIVYNVVEFSRYLIKHFTDWPKRCDDSKVLASAVDPINSYVRVVKSNRAGMGKSLYIQRMKEELQMRRVSSTDSCAVVIPVHGPKVTFDNIVQSLKEPFQYKDSNQAIVFHLDISPNVLRQVDSVLFSLLILQAVSDSQGRIWRCHPSHLYAIEATMLKSDVKYFKSTAALLDILPSIWCMSPSVVCYMLERGQERASFNMMDEREFHSEPYQRVYQYLLRHMNDVSMNKFSYVPKSVEGKHVDCLQVFLKYCGVKNPSWSELKHFIDFLNTQLKSCESSIFCNEDFIKDVMSGLKTFVVKFMIRMSKDFATSSLKGEIATENHEIGDEEWILKDYEIDERKQWEQCYHPYLFFNEDGISITFVGFNVTPNGDIIDPINNRVIEAGAMKKQMHTGLRANGVKLSENYQTWGKDVMIRKIGMVMGLEWNHDPDPTYVLTVDNVIKIMAIHMRFRCNIPVVVMGETGCGKTRLIRYMCDLAAQGCKQGGEHVQNMLIMKVHGGTTESDVIRKVKEAEEISIKNKVYYGIDTVLFFDEANTSDAIGLIKEVMCDRRINGRRIEEDVKFIAACNPYRKHSDEMIAKLETAGLGFFVKANETQQKLGKIPLRQLVYRVLDLPPSMRPLVYDFGQLNNNTEEDYIAQIVKDRCHTIPTVKGHDAVIQLVANVLAWSQRYMRRINDECSFVSLRDVERTMIVFDYFCLKKDQFHERVTRKANEEGKHPINEVARSLILSVSVCYHARLQKRGDYEDGVVQHLKLNGREQFLDEIRWCQDVLLDNMKLGPNIARNAALRENVFMMAICIELRIPLFLVGKPGSSKSLAKSIVADSMLGRSSEEELMKEFKEVHMFSYQCSQLSTPESVIEVFNTARSFQKTQDVTNYVSVVVLDEVGLAEDSPNLPLKALHPLLEDGTEGADGSSEQVISREHRVAFIGISNWALDPAKMNRGVMVTRGDPDIEELIVSARGICSNVKDDPVKDKLSVCFKPLAAAYKEICEVQERCQKPFFGLRDFYSLIKMLYWMCKKSRMQLTGPQLRHAIKRNFGGLDLEGVDTYEIFKFHLKDLEHEPDLSLVTDKSLHDLLSPDCTPLGLIRKSLQTKEISWHGENRYLLFLTENYAALQVIKHYLHDEVGLRHDKTEEGDDQKLDDNRKISEETTSVGHRMEPFVLFGSSFPKDREYTQVCRNINQIKICMETGRTVILLNLENLYESLYDLLNQYYIHLGDQRYVDLGLQTHRVKCRVHNNFKLILIAEKATVYRKFPTPLINRLEKHFVLSETVLLDWQKEVLARLYQWVKDFSEISTDSRFSKQDAFIGYQNDTPASVIFQATQQLTEEWGWPDSCHEKEEWKRAVLARSKKILLLMSPPDALIRLKYTPLDEKREKLSQIYYFDQYHSSLVEFLSHHLHANNNVNGLLIQVTTHSHLLSSTEADELSHCLQIKQMKCFLLQEFDTEMDFSHKISPSFSNAQDESLLIIQCDSGHLYGDLLACARYRIDDEREKKRLRSGGPCTHVLFIIHLPRQASNDATSFVGFQGGPWLSAHIDDIRAPLESALTLNDAQSAPISRLFYSGVFGSHEAMETDDHTKEQSSTQCLVKKDMNDSVDIEATGSGDVLGDGEEKMITEEGSAAVLLSDDEHDISDSDTVLYDGGDDIVENGVNLEEMPMDSSFADLPLRNEMDDDLMEQFSTTNTTTLIVGTKDHSQCSRLYNSIQAAVASLMESGQQSSSAQRVQILLGLIPQSPTFPIDDGTFYGGLVKHIKRLLEEGEKHLLDKEWVLKEAMSGRKLQSGGTFQNVLTRRLDEVIVPIFAAILSSIDQYSNLSLLHQTRDSVKTLWLLIFSNDGLVQFSYQNFMIGRGIDFQAGYRRGKALASDHQFSCQFPFFWLIKEAIEANWEAFRTSSGEHRQDYHIQLCEVLSDNPVASVLQRVSVEDWSELYGYYLMDMLKSVHHVPHHKPNEEYEILKKALDAIITGPDFVPHNSLLSLLLGVHVVYHEYKQEIMWFGQLTAHVPGILIHLIQDVDYNCQDFDLPLQAVKISIGPNSLALPLVPDKREYIPQRLIKLQLCQNAIDTILALGSGHASLSDLTHNIRLTWQCVKAIQLFIEHVAMKCSLDDNKFIIFVQYAKRIDISLKSDSGDIPLDFTKKETVLKVQRVLRALDKEAEKKLKYAANMQKKVRECCESYFMEIVSSLCFGQLSPPDSDLIRELLNVVFTEQQKTKEFTYSERQKTDAVPVIRSFLLQLLLEHNFDQVKEHLSDYFSRAKQVIRSDHSLCLLCIQCLEDAIYKQHSHLPLQRKVEKTLQLLKKGTELVKLGTAPALKGSISLDYLEGVSMLRYTLTVIAELIYSQYNSKEIERTHTHQIQLLLDMTKKFCTDPNINVNDSGPGIFLIKQLARQYGLTFLSNITLNTNMQWIIPENLRQSKEEAAQLVNDPFVIYENYCTLKTTLTDTVYSEDLTQLNLTVKDLPVADVVPLLVGVYQVITGSTVLKVDAKRVTDETRVGILAGIRQSKSFKKELMWVAQHLIQDTYYGRLEPMMLRPGMSPQDRLLTDLIVHVAVSIQQCSNKLLTPFVKMINSPGELKNLYLPTMPEDSLPAVRNAVGRGKFYECPRGHPYFISECGKPMQQYTCPVCHMKIGGEKYKLELANKIARTTDYTETGYALGQPNQRETILSAERSLSPSSCAIIRALMHCSLLWSSCTNEHATEGLLDLMKSRVRPVEMSLFFWQHLNLDVEILSRSIGKSRDDSCLLLHLILKSITTTDKICDPVSLDTKNNRNKWEISFYDTFIQPILSALDAKLHAATVLQLNDKREDQNRLFYVIHEKVKVPHNVISPHLWSYRSRITLEHLSQVLATQKETSPILHEFLKLEPLLRATQYLPAIVKLQQTMYQLSHRKLDKKDVVKVSIGAYMENFIQQKGHERKREQFLEKINCLRKAWVLVKERLKDHARVPVDADIIRTVTWNDDTSLSYLIPTLSGDGVCTVALVDLLVGIHNDFVSKCHSQMKNTQKKDISWKQHKIPASQLQLCHLLTYEHQILSVVISHSHYSLEHGTGHNISYDLPALEKHILDRFILGKPLIQLEIPQVVYRKDIYTAEAFASIRRNVSPQKQLSAKQQTDIVKELGSMQHMRECLDVVEIVIGFLSSGKNNANTELKTYVKRVLKMEKRFKSKKAMEYCTLAHVLSLWETLSVQMAKTLTIRRQEPFDSFSKDLLSTLREEQVEELLSYLKTIDIPPFLNLFYEFIETTVQHYESHDIKIDWSLRDTIYAHLESYELEDMLPHQFQMRFPESITVGQSVEAWKAVVIYQERHEQEVAIK